MIAINPNIQTLPRIKTGFSSTKPAEKLTDVVFLSDIDGTWIDNSEREENVKPALFAINNWVQGLKEKFEKKGIKLMHGYATGRPPDVVASLGLPESEYNIFLNGGEITKGLSKDKRTRFTPWVEENKKFGFNPDIILECVKELAPGKNRKNPQVKPIAEVINNNESNSCNFMKTFCMVDASIDKTPEEIKQNTPLYKSKHVQGYISRLKQKMEEKGQIEGKNFVIVGPYQGFGKEGVVFDVATPVANKGDAIKFLMTSLDKNKKVSPDQLIIACDGGNDLPMCNDKDHQNGDGRRLIILGNNKELKEKALSLKENKVVIRPPEEMSSLGVIRGLQMHLDDIATKLKSE